MVVRKLGRGLEFFLSDSGDGDREESKTPAAPKPKQEPKPKAKAKPTEKKPAAPQPAEPKPPSGDEIAQLDLKSLVVGPHQPRVAFDELELKKLAASLRSSGVLQPILVRKKGDKYEIIAGERRWRAAKMAGLERIPALVRDLTDEAAAVVALVENVQRTDLNAIEKAEAFKRIQEITKATQAEVAKQVGLERSTVANMLRLLELPKAIQKHVSRGTLTMGHARALLGLAGAEEQMLVAGEILKKRLSVRQVESMIQSLNQATEPPNAKSVKEKAVPKGRPAWVNDVEQHLVDALSAKVSVKYGRKRSKITIECGDQTELERIYELLKGAGPAEEE